MNSEYIELNLVKVISNDKSCSFFAVSNETLEDMEDSSSSMEYIVCDNPDHYKSMQFKVDRVGKVLVETRNLRDINE